MRESPAQRLIQWAWGMAGLRGTFQGSPGDAMYIQERSRTPVLGEGLANHTHGPNVAHLHLWVKFYWNAAALSFHLRTVYGCFCAPTTELSSHERDSIAYKVQSIYYLALHRKSLFTSVLEFQSCDMFFFSARNSINVFRKGFLHCMTVKSAHHWANPAFALTELLLKSMAFLPHHCLQCHQHSALHTFLSPSSPAVVINKAQSYTNRAAVF